MKKDIKIILSIIIGMLILIGILFYFFPIGLSTVSAGCRTSVEYNDCETIRTLAGSFSSSDNIYVSGRTTTSCTNTNKIICVSDNSYSECSNSNSNYEPIKVCYGNTVTNCGDIPGASCQYSGGGCLSGYIEVDGKCNSPNVCCVQGVENKCTNPNANSNEYLCRESDIYKCINSIEGWDRIEPCEFGCKSENQISTSSDLCKQPSCNPPCPVASQIECGIQISPFDGCVGPCQAGTKCPSGQSCINNECIGSQCEFGGQNFAKSSYFCSPYDNCNTDNYYCGTDENYRYKKYMNDDCSITTTKYSCGSGNICQGGNCVSSSSELCEFGGESFAKNSYFCDPYVDYCNTNNYYCLETSNAKARKYMNNDCSITTTKVDCKLDEHCEQGECIKTGGPIAGKCDFGGQSFDINKDFCSPFDVCNTDNYYCSELNSDTRYKKHMNGDCTITTTKKVCGSGEICISGNCIEADCHNNPDLVQCNSDEVCIETSVLGFLFKQWKCEPTKEHCTNSKQCDDGNQCTVDRCVSQLIGDNQCEYEDVLNCDEKIKCEDNGDKWIEDINKDGGFWCSTFGVGCTIYDDSYCQSKWIIYGMYIVIAVVVLSIILFFVFKKNSGKSNLLSF